MQITDSSGSLVRRRKKNEKGRKQEHEKREGKQMRRQRGAEGRMTRVLRNREPELASTTDS